MALLPEDLLNYNRYIEEVLDLLEETIQEDESLEGTVSTQVRTCTLRMYLKDTVSNHVT